MKSVKNFSPYKNLAADIPASIVVFLVAMPLCLGIALASGAPLFSGLIAGMIGGIVVGTFSGSALGVSGPAAGLAVIVLTAIQDLGGYEMFLVAVVLAGLIQLVIGFLKGGVIANFFPSSVIMGMLAAIGIIIFFKQIPHAFGYDADPIGEMAFQQVDDQNTFSELLNMLKFINPGALIITLVSLAILLVYEVNAVKTLKFAKIIPGPLMAVIAGIFLAKAFSGNQQLAIDSSHMVQIPIADSFSGFLSNFTFPNWRALTNPDIYVTAIVIAIVASLETLLCVEATDKIDPYKRITPTNQELKAQGIGNMVSGLIGGLPITQVIVRSSANLQSGGLTKASTILHGFLILISIVAIPNILNLIPLATLAAVLLIVGYKLAKPALFKKMYKQGNGQFIPFLITILAIVFTDLLVGLGIGLLVSILFLLYNNMQSPFKIEHNQKNTEHIFRIKLSQEVSFLNKSSILETLKQVPNGSTVEIDYSETVYVHHDVQEIIDDFKTTTDERSITLVEIRQNNESLKQRSASEEMKKINKVLNTSTKESSN